MDRHTEKWSPDFFIRDAGLPRGTVFIPSLIGRWKRKGRERTPPWYTRVKNCLTRPMRVSYSDALLRRYFFYSSAFCLLPFSLLFLPVYRHIINMKERECDMKIKEKGLTQAEVEEARRLYGDNSLKRARTKGFLHRFFENLGDPIIKVLLIALGLEVIFTFGNCNFIEIGGIIAAILIATLVSTISEQGSERAFARIEAETRNSRIRALRDGRVVELDADALVVGDVVLLSVGEKIQADGVLIEGEISVDQSALNGENREVNKHCGKPKGWELNDESRVFRGSIITEGSAIMRVERVGEKSYYGMVAGDIQEETRTSPLKLRLSKLASQISRLGYIVAGIVGLVYLFNTLIVDNGYNTEAIITSVSDLRFLATTLIHTLTLMITVIVVAVPEGLPMMITVVLSMNMRRMVRDNILVKKLVGIETAGSMNILFTDKTGTLTSGQITLDRIITDKGLYRGLTALTASHSIYEALYLCSEYNTDTQRTEDGVVGGNSTDRAIREFFEKSPLLEGNVRKIKEKTPFSSELKYSSVRFEDGVTIIKGAAEIILSRCRYAMAEDGKAYVSDLSTVTRQYKDALTKGERVLAVAVDRGDGELIFVALLVLRDKLRSGVKQAVADILSARIQIVMVTGDNLDTAVSIATECGFFNKNAGHRALDGTELRELTDEELKAIIPSLRVVARALPRDKSRLVRLSQERNLVVGMTGDGINDAPSLKLADVGFAMGSGSDIAKGAGDIIILDDSISAIAKTVLYGRTIFKSIRKFICFQLIMNFAACGITLIGPFIGVDTPITIIQMLWVNIIMDTLGGMAFAGEPPLGYYMKEKPKRREEPILSRQTISHIISNGVFTLTLMVLFLRLDLFRELFATSSLHLSAFYALFIFAGLFNCLSARCERFFILSNIGKNKACVFILIFISIIQLLIIYFGGSIFRSAPLSLGELFIVVGLAFSVLVFDLIRRLIKKLS